MTGWEVDRRAEIAKEAEPVLQRLYEFRVQDHGMDLDGLRMLALGTVLTLSDVWLLVARHGTEPQKLRMVVDDLVTAVPLAVGAFTCHPWQFKQRRRLRAALAEIDSRLPITAAGGQQRAPDGGSNRGAS